MAGRAATYKTKCWREHLLMVEPRSRPVNHIKILFFAILRDQAGARSLELDVEPGIRIEELKAILAEKYPALRDSLAHCLTSIDREYCLDETPLPPSAEIAFFPPVSGG